MVQSPLYSIPLTIAIALLQSILIYPVKFMPYVLGLYRPALKLIHQGFGTESISYLWG